MSQELLLPLSVPQEEHGHEEVSKRLQIIEYKNTTIHRAPALPVQEIQLLVQKKLDGELSTEEYSIIEKLREERVLEFNKLDRSLAQTCWLVDNLKSLSEDDLSEISKGLKKYPSMRSFGADSLQNKLKQKFNRVYDFLPYLRAKLAILELIAFVSGQPEDYINLLKIDIEYLRCSQVSDKIIQLKRDAASSKIIYGDMSKNTKKLINEVKNAIHVGKTGKYSTRYWTAIGKAREMVALIVSKEKNEQRTKKIFDSVIQSSTSNESWNLLDSINIKKGLSNNHDHVKDKKTTALKDAAYESLEIAGHIPSAETLKKMLTKHKLSYFLGQYPPTITTNLPLLEMLDLDWTSKKAPFTKDFSLQYLSEYKYSLSRNRF